MDKLTNTLNNKKEKDNELYYTCVMMLQAQKLIKYNYRLHY